MGRMRINKFGSVVDKMEKQGKITRVSKEKSSEIFNKIDNDLRDFRRELSKKESYSNSEAATITLK